MSTMSYRMRVALLFMVVSRHVELAEAGDTKQPPVANSTVVEKLQQAATALATTLAQGAMARRSGQKDQLSRGIPKMRGASRGRQLTNGDLQCSWADGACSMSGSWAEERLQNLPPQAASRRYWQAVADGPCQSHSDETSCISEYALCSWSAAEQVCLETNGALNSALMGAEMQEWIPADGCGLLEFSFGAEDCFSVSISECSSTVGCMVASSCDTSICLPDTTAFFSMACGSGFDYLDAIVSCTLESDFDLALSGACMDDRCPSLSPYFSVLNSYVGECMGLSTASDCSANGKCAWRPPPMGCIANTHLVTLEAASSSCRWRPWFEAQATCAASASASSCNQNSDCRWLNYAVCQSGSVVSEGSCEATFLPQATLVYDEACDSADAVSLVNIITAETACHGAVTEAACEATTSLTQQVCESSQGTTVRTPAPNESCSGNCTPEDGATRAPASQARQQAAGAAVVVLIALNMVKWCA
mmetsp:Transcript_31685/g.72311  ORF Transcript_31685/g.72311 Transcript_31685/m.72311 type:complete len:477 (+) Transcript_31685:84-1514(+)